MREIDVKTHYLDKVEVCGCLGKLTSAYYCFIHDQVEDEINVLIALSAFRDKIP